MRPDNLYIVKGEIKRSVIGHRDGYVNGSHRVFLTFRKPDGSTVESNGFNPENVIVAPFIRTEDGEFRVHNKEGYYRLVHTIHFFGNSRSEYLGVEVRGGFIEYFHSSDISVERSLKNDSDRVLSYLYKLSALSTMEDENGNISSLSQKYDANRFVFDGSLFAKYIHPDKYKCHKSIAPQLLIFPFGCNNGQWKATRNAVSSEVSIVQGPPGTGKTQTILNIVANYVVAGKSLEIVSNNNSAVANVLEKLEKYGYGFFAAMLGNKNNVDSFLLKQTGAYPDITNWKRDEARKTALKEDLATISSLLPRLFDSTEKVAALKEHIALFKEQLGSDGEVLLSGRVGKASSIKLYQLLLLIDESIYRWGKMSFRARFQLRCIGINPKRFDRDAFERIARLRRLSEMECELKDLQQWCDGFAPRYQAYVALSKELFEALLYDRYGGKTARPIFNDKDARKNTTAFLKEYPLVLSSTFSATTNTDPLIPFDVIIMDEASQVDIAAGALALNCAKNAVIVGDEKQLPNVVTRALYEKSEALFSEYGIPEPYRLSGNSFLSSAQKVFKEAPISFLREHYRCEPRIIGYCNSQFYGGRLVPMTTRSEYPSMKVIQTVVGNHARGHSNQRQAEEAVNEVLQLNSNYSDIGIIVPYNEQAELIKEILNRHSISSIPVSTVHKFQGRECDAIILCTVDNTIKEFVDDPHLLNVAVSRAKKHFTLIVNGGDIPNSNIKDLVDYTMNCAGIVKGGNIKSVFDMLYAQYTEEREHFVREHIGISEYSSECLMYDLLKDLTREGEWSKLNYESQYPLSQLVPSGCVLTEEERSYSQHFWTKVDFLLFERTTKNPVLVIEVDGMSFHAKNTEQWSRDRKKDSILEKAGIPLLRLPTNGSREREKIIEELIRIYV